MDFKKLLENAINASLLAGKEIMKVYESDDFDVQLKSDSSPLTKADLAAHNRIKDILKETNIPMLSEEGKTIDFSERTKWELFWLVDPLDGTKEFVKRNGEFTVNIALVEKGRSIMGVIYVPCLKTLYFGAPGIGTYKTNNIAETITKSVDELISISEKLPLDKKSDQYSVVASKSHLNEDTQKYIDKIKDEKGDIAFISKGSSLKICMVAEGLANVYPRYAPTMEWDTAAGHAIAKNAGFNVYQVNEKDELVYNKENLLNPYFIVK